jgi:hypothetical protein
MNKGIFEVIKANKKEIIKKALIIGGSIAGLAIVSKIALSKGDDDEEESTNNEATETSEENSDGEEENE